MPITPNFTAAQVLALPSQVVITETSTGTDVLVTQRRIYLAKANGSFLVPTGTATEYIAWALGTTTKTIDVLDKDYSLLITLQYLNVSNVVLYSKVLLYGFTLYNETFDYSTTQMLTANNGLISDTNFWRNKSDLRTYIDAGDKAVSLASDQSGAQLCYDAATNLRLNSQYYFNANA